MKTLPPIRPTKEQLPLISENRYGVEVIRGAAGSGKTSTAILRLRSLLYIVQERFEREGIDRPLKILVLTFNRTLSGYVRLLAREQIVPRSSAEMLIDTFAGWAISNLGSCNVVGNDAREQKLTDLARGLPLSAKYLVGEVDYLLGRFEPERIEDYITAERAGRGIEPRVDRALRRRILDELVGPYRDWLSIRGWFDWNDVAVRMARTRARIGYDIAIVDEAQDFSANQLRGLRHHMADTHAVTFVIDTIQRIYARGFGWQETGFDMRGARYHTLRENHRNTKQIARFARGILRGIPVESDGAMPDLRAATRDGDLPVVMKGLYSQQVNAAFDFLARHVDLRKESVAFLAPLGGGYFQYLRSRLDSAGLAYGEITRETEWPTGPENVAICTFHSAKGLEFDHVFILGLNAENTAHDSSSESDQLEVLRRLLAVAVARARQTVAIGYKPGEQSRLVDYFEVGTFLERSL